MKAGRISLLTSLIDLGFSIADRVRARRLRRGVYAGQDEQRILETLISQYVGNMEFNLGIPENLARSLARSAAVRKGQVLSVLEMQSLIDQLFACEMPFKSPNGKKCFLTYELEEIFKALS